MSENFDFPASFGEIELVEGNNDEGPVPRTAPAGAVAAPPGTPPTTFRLRRVADNMQMVELTGYGDVGNFAYDPPPGHVPQGPMQWFLKRPGDSRFAPFGNVFQYRQEKNSYWERNGL